MKKTDTVLVLSAAGRSNPYRWILSAIASALRRLNPFFNSHLKGDARIARIQEIGPEAFASEMAKQGKMTIRR